MQPYAMTRPRRRLTLDANAAQAFAAFLRAYGEAWRLRRLDRFEPEDFHLANHHTSLQGRIPASLFRLFVTQSGEAVGLKGVSLAEGDELVAIIPVSTHAKQSLYHHLSARDEAGASLPVCTRMQSATISAAYLLSAIVEAGQARALGLFRGWSGSDKTSVIRLLTTFAYLNPHALADRIDRWAVQTRMPERVGAVPTYDITRDWMSHEADRFLDDFSSELDLVIDDVCRSGPYILLPAARRGGGLERFPHLLGLARCGVRDLLKVIVEREPIWANDGTAAPESPRSALLDRPTALATNVAETLRVGMERLDDLLVAQSRGVAVEELLTHLDRSTVYVVRTVRLGEPFIVKFDELLPLSQTARGWEEYKRAVGQSVYSLPLAFKDAQAVHVEFECGDPELRLGQRKVDLRLATRELRIKDTWYSLRLAWPPRLGRATEVTPALKVGSLPSPVAIERYFGQRDEPSEQALSLYTSRTKREATERDLGALHLLVPVRVALFVYLAYTAASLSAVMAAIFTGGAWLDAIWRVHEGRGGHYLFDTVSVVSVNAVAVTLSVWLTAAQHRRPVIHKKMWAARVAIAISIGVFVLAPLAFGIDWMLTQGHSDPINRRSLDATVFAAVVVLLLRALRRTRVRRVS